MTFGRNSRSLTRSGAWERTRSHIRHQQGGGTLGTELRLSSLPQGNPPLILLTVIRRPLPMDEAFLRWMQDRHLRGYFRAYMFPWPGGASHVEFAALDETEAAERTGGLLTRFVPRGPDDDAIIAGMNNLQSNELIRGWRMLRATWISVRRSWGICRIHGPNAGRTEAGQPCLPAAAG